MTETEWLRSADACALLDHLFPQQGFDSTSQQTRKLRLYLVALCREAWRDLPAACRATTEFAERLADEPHTDPALREAVRQVAERMTAAWKHAEVVAACERDLAALGLEVPDASPRIASAAEWRQLTWLAFLPHWADRPPFRWVAPSAHRADLVRDVFGNPFRPPEFRPEWRTSTAEALARSMYDARDFAPMPILADALEETGCQDEEVLAHCRGDGPHARGCWVVDHVLGRG